MDTTEDPDGVHTVQYDYTGPVVHIIPATLATTPTESDWFDVDIVTS